MKLWQIMMLKDALQKNRKINPYYKLRRHLYEPPKEKKHNPFIEQWVTAIVLFVFVSLFFAFLYFLLKFN